LKLSSRLWRLGWKKFFRLHMALGAVFDIPVSPSEREPSLIVVKGQTVPKGLAVVTHPTVIGSESRRKLLFVDIFMTFYAVPLRLVCENIFMSRMGRFHRENALRLNMALDTVLTNLGVGINQLKIRLVVIEFALITEVLRIMAEIAASVIKFVMELLFMWRSMAIDTEIFFGIGESVDFFAFDLVTGLTSGTGVISRERKSSHPVVIEAG
jgi:hypothetical protein